jgi:hypothetical protein
MRKSKILTRSFILASACLPVIASADTVLFQQNFDVAGAGALFTLDTTNSDPSDLTNVTDRDFAIDYNYDYGSFQYLLFPLGGSELPTVQPIPSAPGSGGTTRGLRISVNDSANFVGAETVQLIPTGIANTGDYRMEVEMWMNYNGPALGGSGSTEAMVIGLNRNGGTGIIGPAPVAFAPTAVNGYAFTVNGEGGAANDMRMYDRGETAGFDDGPAFPKVNGTWVAYSELRFDRTTGNLITVAGPAGVLDTPSNHTNSYMDTVFPGDAIGGGQFETRGAPGKGWVPVVVEQVGNEVRFSMNGKHISTLYNEAPLTGSPQLGYTDEFNSVANPASDNFIVFDNLKITSLTQASQFNQNSGNYSAAGSWNGAVPNAAGTTANFVGGGGAATVTVDVPVTLRSMHFNNASGMTVSGANTITLTGDSSSMVTNTGVNTVSAPINSNDHLSVWTAANATLVTSNFTHSTTKNIAKAGTGTWEVNKIEADGLVSTGGTIKLTPGGGTSRVQVLNLLNSTSKLDITNNAVVVDWLFREDPANPSINTNPSLTPLTGIAAEITSAYNGGGANAWTGVGLTSSQANANTHAVGWAESTALTTIPAIFGTVDGSSVLIRFTRYGDADLSGNVNSDDFNRLATNFGLTGKVWSDGNFNYDPLGAVDSDDFNLLATSFGLAATGPNGEVTPQDWAALAAAVPEPGTLGLLGLGALATLPRRRRR